MDRWIIGLSTARRTGHTNATAPNAQPNHTTYTHMNTKPTRRYFGFLCYNALFVFIVSGTIFETVRATLPIACVVCALGGQPARAIAAQPPSKPIPFHTD